LRGQFSLVLAERVRLSQEIHDTLLQSLVGVAMHLDAAANAIGEPDQSKKSHLRHVRRQIEEYLRDARQTVWNLRSDTAQTVELVPALRKAGDHAVRDSSTQFLFQTKGALRPISPVVQGQLLRIAQEALTNAMHHAAPSQLGMELAYTDAGLLLTVSDNGRGFDLDAVTRNPGEHCGILIMHERAQQIGGVLKIVARHDSGTSLEVFVPTRMNEGQSGRWWQLTSRRGTS
jgi:two-component system sensor histidine kinase DegS